MAHYEDLEPCTAFPGEWRDLLAVGWLAKDHEYSRGEVEPEVVDRLTRIFSWAPPDAPRGAHVCELCMCEDGPPAGAGSIFVAGEGVLYVAPRLIAHYIRRHGYRPPPAFLEALRASPGGATQSQIVAHLVGYLAPAAPSNPYVPAELTVLEGLDPVRVRPGMYIGPGPRRAEELVSIIVNVFIKGHLTGATTRVSVDINDRGWVTVEDDGRGISIDRRQPREPPWVEVLFGGLSGFHFHSDEFPKEAVSPGHYIRHKPWFSSPAVVTALSARLELETRPDGNACRLEFASGHLLRSVTKVGASPKRGTVVRFLADDEIYGDGVRPALEAVERRLRDVARLCPRLHIEFQGRSLSCPEGLAAWPLEAAPELVKETLLSAHGTVREVDVEVAFAWRPRASAPLIRSFLNFAETPDGGSHERGLISAVEQVNAAKRASRKKKVLSGLVGIVHVGAESPQLRGLSPEDEAVRVAVRDVVTRAINEAPWWWDKLHEAIG